MSADRHSQQMNGGAQMPFPYAADIPDPTAEPQPDTTRSAPPNASAHHTPSTPEEAMQIPTALPELTAVLATIPSIQRQQVCEQLAEQLGNQEQAYALFEQAETEVRHAEEIEALRAELGTVLGEAASSLRMAESLIERLASSAVYDVEYAESVTAEDLRHTVAKASRAARIAAALQKQIEH